MPLDPLRAVGAVQAGAAVGAEVVAGLYVDPRVSTHGALLSLACRHPPNAREPPHITHSGRTVPVTAVIRPMRAPAPRSPPVCLDRRRALPPRLRGAAELKFVPSKCRPHPVHFFIDLCRPRTAGIKLSRDKIVRAGDAPHGALRARHAAKGDTGKVQENAPLGDARAPCGDVRRGL